MIPNEFDPDALTALTLTNPGPLPQPGLAGGSGTHSSFSVRDGNEKVRDADDHLIDDKDSQSLTQSQFESQSHSDAEVLGPGSQALGGPGTGLGFARQLEEQHLTAGPFDADGSNASGAEDSSVGCSQSLSQSHSHSLSH